jgi:hypothetical protein
MMLHEIIMANISLRRRVAITDRQGAHVHARDRVAYHDGKDLEAGTVLSATPLWLTVRPDEETTTVRVRPWKTLVIVQTFSEKRLTAA